MRRGLMVLPLEAEDRDREGATDLGIKLFGCRIRASTEYRIQGKSEGGGRVSADSDVEPDCSEIVDSGSGKAEHPFEVVQIIHSNSREAVAESIDHELANNFRKPEKILPCPRCNSLETKFCYFNNYNASQPRHFCRNCQRYWTAGGTMRNVPVGAGRRKNKQLPFPYFQMVASPAPESISFSEKSMSESVETVFPVGDQDSSASCKDETQFERFCVFPQSRSTCFLPLNQLWTNSATGPMLAVPGFTLETIPLQIMAAPYWGCISTGNAASAGLQNGSSSHCSVLGKHPRDTANTIYAPRALKINNSTDTSQDCP